MDIYLSEEEIIEAESFGKTRHMESVLRGRKRAEEQSAEASEFGHVAHSLACMAASKAFKLPWKKQLFKWRNSADIGEGTKVKYRKNPNGGLLINPRDPEDFYYVLVTGSKPRFRIIGYKKGSEAKQEKYLDEFSFRVPLFSVPQDELIKVKV